MGYEERYHKSDYLESKMIMMIKDLPHFPEPSKVLWKHIRKKEKKLMESFFITEYKPIGFKQFKRLYLKYNKKKTEVQNENITRGN